MKLPTANWFVSLSFAKQILKRLKPKLYGPDHNK
jgi:hypothetical protein